MHFTYFAASCFVFFCHGPYLCATVPLMEDVIVRALTLCFNGSWSLTVELNYISTLLMEHQITLWALLSCICSGQKNVVWQWTWLSQTMDFSFRTWNNSTWHLTLSMNSHHWALRGCEVWLGTIVAPGRWQTQPRHDLIQSQVVDLLCTLELSLSRTPDKQFVG